MTAEVASAPTPTVAPAPENVPAVAACGPGFVAALSAPGQVLAMQRTAGNTAVTRFLARLKGPAPAAGPKLRTALDSSLRTEAAGDGYKAILQLEGRSQSIALPVAEYHAKADTELKHLPVYLEDVVSGNRAVVTIRYDATVAEVKPAFLTQTVDGIEVEVRLVAATAEEMTVGGAAKARQVHGGVTVSGGETVTEHEGASRIDKVMGSVASAEGGFATVEGSDKGVLTWGQGQWTVTTGELQRVLAFIKSHRPDLFDRYWGAAGLDVGTRSKPDFIHDGKPQSRDSKTMMKLFRPNLDKIKFWAGLFAQAGMDPQVQRLQREFMRGEVAELLAKPVSGHAPQDVLDTRGQAFYYSMDKNAPKYSGPAFRDATKSLPAGGTVTEAQKAKASADLEAYFRNSSVVAFSKDSHHIIAFWGEGGRKRALKQADEAIAAGGDDTWTAEQWTKHRAAMAARQSRYSKTKADIDKALNRQDVEPDVPADLVQPGDAVGPLLTPHAPSAAPAPVAPPAPAPAAAPAAAPAHSAAQLPAPPTVSLPSPPAATPATPGPPLPTGPGADAIAADIAALEVKVGKLNMDQTEAVGGGRDNLVADIAAVRAKIAALQLPPDQKAAFYARLNVVAPSYHQFKNVDILESATSTRTCNITALAMALEAAGKSTKSYKGNQAVLQAIATKYSTKMAGAKDRVGDDLTGLRLPDFLELAAIAKELGGTPATEEAIQKAAEKAWNSILSIYFLADLADLFGKGHADIFVKKSHLGQRKKTGSKDFDALRKIGATGRTPAEKRADDENERTQLQAQIGSLTGKAKDKAQKRLDALEAGLVQPAALSSDETEASVPLIEYRDTVLETLGAGLQAGTQYVVAMTGHYVRLQSVAEDGIIVDDPARGTRANRHLTWEEARSMGLFQDWCAVS